MSELEKMYDEVQERWGYACSLIAEFVNYTSDWTAQVMLIEAMKSAKKSLEDFALYQYGIGAPIIKKNSKSV